jgi:hypothetical protein
MYKGCHVRFDVTVQADPSHDSWLTARQALNYVYVIPSYPRPHQKSTTGQALEWNGHEYLWLQDNMGDWNQDATDWEIAHEAGHLFGLFDEYNTATGLPFPYHEGTMMGQYNGSVTQDEINAIVGPRVPECRCSK